MLAIGAAGCRWVPGDEDRAGQIVAGQGADASARKQEETSDPAEPAASSDDAAPRSGAREPGRGVVAGRLIDGATGLPVPDVQVQLIETGRRTLSGANGTFRFDGVPPGALTVAFGPSDAHVVASRTARVGPAGFDFGLVPMLAADAPTYVAPEFGGVAAGCGATRIAVAADALDAPLALRVTCLPDEAAFPAAAPAGRLPLAVVDLSPGDRTLAMPARVTLALPAQPRFAPGIALDLLQLDVRRLTWDRVGAATVDAGGETASGQVGVLAPVMVVAPPFGSMGAAADAPPTIARYNVAERADGEPTDVFGPRAVVVYAAFDYAGMSNTTVRVKTTDAGGATRFESRRPYTGAGHDDVPMLGEDGQPWPVGDYLTQWSIGEPPVAVGKAVAWSISDRPTPGPTAVALVIAPGLASEGVSMDAPYGLDGLPPRAVPVGAAGCARPPGWVEYTVQAGDSLSALALGTGVDVATLMGANCLRSDAIFAGRLLYLARFPAKPVDTGGWPPAYGPKPGPQWPPVFATKPPVPFYATRPPSGGLPPIWPTKPPPPPATLAPLPYPTTWYTPPAPAPVDAGPIPGAGAVGGAGAAPPSAPQPFVPPQSPTRMPPKDPNPAEPTLAPRPMP